MVAGAGGNVERDVIFRLKAEVDAKSFQALSRFGKAASKIQTEIDKGIERSSKKRATIEEKAAQTAQRQREKAFTAEQKLLARGAKLIQKALDDRQKAAEKAARAEQKVREQSEKQLEKRRSEFVKNREKGLKAEQKAIEAATKQAVIFQKKGEAATKRFTAEIKKAASGALLLARGLAFVGAASKEDLGKVVRAIVQIQGAFDILRGGERVIRSIIAAQKALAIATQAATAAQLAQNVVQSAAGGIAGGAAGGAAGGIAGRVAGGVAGRAGFIGAAALAAPAASIGIAAVAVVGTLAVFNKDFRQGLGEFLGILESETERAKKTLQKRIELDNREAANRLRRFQIERRSQEQLAQLFGRRQAAAVRFGAVPEREAAQDVLTRATERQEEARGALEAAKGRPGGLREIQAERAAADKILEQRTKSLKLAKEAADTRSRGAIKEFFVNTKLQLANENVLFFEKQLVGLKDNALELANKENNLLKETQGLADKLTETTKARVDAEIQSGEAIRRVGEKQVQATRDRVTEQKKSVDLAQRELELQKNKTDQLAEQLRTTKQQFGALSRGEQRRVRRLIERAQGGRDLSVRQLQQIQQFAPEVAARQFERRAERGGFEEIEPIREQRQELAISRARERDLEAQRALAERNLQQTEALLERQITKNKEDLINLFNEKIDPVFKGLGDAIATSIEIAVQKLASEIRLKQTMDQGLV